MSFRLRLQLKHQPSIHWLTISLAIASCIAMAVKYTNRGVLLDWDIDTFIEISSNFIGGRLLYLDYFDPKWPHVQPLFILPVLTRSVNSQIWFSSLMIIVSGILISRLPCNVAGSSSPTHASVMCGASYIAITPYLPGGVQGQLGVYASLLLLCSVTLYLKGLKNKGKYCCILLGLAGFLTGYAIGIRPNLIVPATLVGSLVVYYNRSDIFLHRILACGLVFGVFIPFLPYFQSPESLQIAFSGSIGILQEWNKSFYDELTTVQFVQQLSVLWSPRIFSVPFWLFIPLIASCCLVQINKNRQHNLKILISIILWELGLVISYRISHIHHHYILLEWAGILTGLSLMQSGRPSKSICLLFCIIVMAVTVTPMKPLSNQDRDMVSSIEGFNDLIRTLTKNQQISAPSLPRLHWQNKKPIRSKGIHPVWSIDIMHRNLKGEHAQRLGLDTAWKQQCKLWLQPDVIYFFADDYLSRQCGIDGFSDWQLHKQNNGSDLGAQGIKVYSRS